MIKYKANVLYNGNHYHSGEVVIGSKIKVEGFKTFLYDDEENYVNGIGDFTRNEWVEINPKTLVEVEE